MHAMQCATLGACRPSRSAPRSRGRARAPGSSARSASSPTPRRSGCRSSSSAPRAPSSPTSTATRSSTSPAASAASPSGTPTPRVTSAVQAQVARFLHTDFTIMPYDSYVELAERLCARLPITGADQGRVLQQRRRGRRERRQDRQGGHRPAGRDRLRGRVPRPHAHGDVADLEAASVQGGLRAVRARGLPRRVPVRVPLAGRRRRLRPARSTTCAAPSRRASRPSRSPPS